MRRSVLLSLPLTLALLLGATPSGEAAAPVGADLRTAGSVSSSVAGAVAEAGPSAVAERRAGAKKRHSHASHHHGARGKHHGHKHRWHHQKKKRAAKPTPPPRTPGATPEVGVQFHGMWGSYTDADRAKVLDRMVDMGSTWVRIDMSWAMLQPERGPIRPDSWGVQNINKVITMASSRGLKVLGTLWMTPAWARPSGSDERTAPSNPSDYGQAFAWATDHWSGKVQAWEVWNEPNSTDFLTNSDPAAYTRMLCSAYNATQALPGPAGAQVVYGGTMHNDLSWIEKTYAAGAKGCFDVMATHPYQSPSNTAAMTGRGTEPWEFASLRAVRQIMARNNDYRAVWITEFGWSSHANSGNEPAWARGVTEQQQADFTVGAIKALRTNFPFVKKAFIYNDRATVGEGTHLAGYGILNADESPKPVWHALRAYLR